MASASSNTHLENAMHCYLKLCDFIEQLVRTKRGSYVSPDTLRGGCGYVGDLFVHHVRRSHVLAENA